MKRIAALACLLIASTCGGSSPTAPGGGESTGRAALAISVMTIEPERDGNGYAYTVRLTAQNTGQAAATLTSLSYRIVFPSGPAGTATLSIAEAFGSATIAAGASRSSADITLSASSNTQFASSITATLNYSDVGGGNTTGRTETVPSLPSAPTPPPPTTSTFTLSGSVRADGGGGLGGAEVEVIYSANDRIKFNADGSGNYSRSGLRGGNVTVRASRSEYVTQELTITLSGNRRLDFALQRSAPPPAPPAPSSCSVAAGPYTWDANVQRCRASNGQFAASACCGR